jgi:hypothetical protein
VAAAVAAVIPMKGWRVLGNAQVWELQCGLGKRLWAARGYGSEKEGEFGSDDVHGGGGGALCGGGAIVHAGETNRSGFIYGRARL